MRRVALMWMMALWLGCAPTRTMAAAFRPALSRRTHVTAALSAGLAIDRVARAASLWSLGGACRVAPVYVWPDVLEANIAQPQDLPGLYGRLQAAGYSQGEPEELAPVSHVPQRAPRTVALKAA